MPEPTLKLIEDGSSRRTFSEQVGDLLRPRSPGSPMVLDLFAGCGGLALGFEAQGFDTLGFELDADACATYNANLHGACEQVLITPETAFPRASVVIGGPPCQPFSVGGQQRGIEDARDGFPSFISAVKQVDPEIWLFENVRGLFYRSRDYLDTILDELGKLGYQISAALLNAKHFGVPQNRERLIVVGSRGSRDTFTWPTTSSEPLVTAGEALGELAHSVPADAKFLTPNMDAYIARYEKASKCARPRDLHLDRPARTVTCRNIAGATGDMHRIRLSDGRRRRITIREAARLQSFPDWFEFIGGETARFNQIGNAVPPLFAYQLAGAVKAALRPAQTPEPDAAMAF